MRLPIVLAALAIAAAATAQPAFQPAVRTLALKDAKGASAGTVAVEAAPKGVLLHVRATGLTPGWHGIHIHSVGDCSDAAAGFKKSGAHVHEGAAPAVHGLLNPAATDEGDLPNIHADARGAATADLFTTAVTLAKLTDADGSAIIVHAKPDDYRTQPIGGAGDRVACAVVRPAA